MCCTVLYFAICLSCCFREFQPSGSYDVTQVVNCLCKEGAFLTKALRRRFTFPSVPVGGGLVDHGLFLRKRICHPSIRVPTAASLPIVQRPTLFGRGQGCILGEMASEQIETGHGDL